MASARKKPNRAGKYQGFFLNMNGQRVFFTGTHDRRETIRMAERLEDEHRQIRLGYREPPKSASKHKARPFAEVKDEYLAWAKPRVDEAVDRGLNAMPTTRLNILQCGKPGLALKPWETWMGLCRK